MRPFKRRKRLSARHTIESEHVTITCIMAGQLLPRDTDAPDAIDAAKAQEQLQTGAQFVAQLFSSNWERVEAKFDAIPKPPEPTQERLDFLEEARTW